MSRVRDAWDVLRGRAWAERPYTPRPIDWPKIEAAIAAIKGHRSWAEIKASKAPSQWREAAERRAGKYP